MKYVISSATFTSKKKAVGQLEEWLREGTLDEKAKVYQVKKEFIPVVVKKVVVKKIELKEVTK